MRSVLHVDMDAFYASIEQLDNPSYQGHPVIVGADPRNGKGRGVVAACSYEARRFGVRSALPISRAWKLCPGGVYVRPRMERYIEVSHEVMKVFRKFTDLVEPLSIDEAFLDVTGSRTLLGPPQQIAVSIKREIRETTGLTASVGVAPNKFLAKIASDLQKPDGLVIVEENAVDDFLRDLPVSRLWGVGPKTEKLLHGLGIRTIGQIRAMTRENLVTQLGNFGEHVYQLSRGNDDRPVVPNWEAKSISNETTFEQDTDDRAFLLKTILNLADHVAERIRKEGYRARRVTLKLRYANFSTHTKQVSLDKPVQTGEAIARAARSLFDQFPLDRKIRLIGVGTSDFLKDGRDSQQLGLFLEPDPGENLSRTVDRLRERFGHSSIKRGSQLS
jgi:nucleotidyltransferase/DNA polymerase involved in DNA repair